MKEWIVYECKTPDGYYIGSTGEGLHRRSIKHWSDAGVSMFVRSTNVAPILIKYRRDEIEWKELEAFDNKNEALDAEKQYIRKYIDKYGMWNVINHQPEKERIIKDERKMKEEWFKTLKREVEIRRYRKKNFKDIFNKYIEMYNKIPKPEKQIVEVPKSLDGGVFMEEFMRRNGESRRLSEFI